ncbi:hypothetical protein F2Q69_00003959 [Brassica cretica]|uniref:Uncharacterized protein n=1 Tax=Brassica cretica TaxID=69181 RepID=A0A8S9PHA3_BRACR|nr:hypothetical protein F2Q69_00003959 [Brassica cretica]
MNCGDEAGASSGHLDWRFSLVKKSKKLWDINLDSGPVSTFQLCDLYENDSVFDKFECFLNGDGLRVATCSLQRCLRQVTTPARPSRPSLSSTTRVVRRGKIRDAYISSSAPLYALSLSLFVTSLTLFLTDQMVGDSNHWCLIDRGERKEIFTCRTQILSRALGSFVLLSDDPSQDPNPGSSLAMAKILGLRFPESVLGDIGFNEVSLWDMKSGEANSKTFQVFNKISVIEAVWDLLVTVQNEIFEEMRSHGLIGSHGFIVRLWILPSGLLFLKQALCLVSSNQSQRVELDMAKIRKGVLRLAQISARIETRIVDELYLDLASIHPAESGSANFMLVEDHTFCL